MYFTILILANIPLYLLIGWIFFDNGDHAKETFFEAILTLLKSFVPPLVRVFLGWDEDDGFGTIEIVAFLAGCIAITFGEHFLLMNYVFNTASPE